MGEGEMKKTLEPLMAACLLASVAQAQFCDVEHDLIGTEVSSVLKIDGAADTATDRFDAGNIQSEFQSRDLSPAGTFHHGLEIGAGQISVGGHPLEGLSWEPTSIFEFPSPELAKSDMISTWFHETKPSFQFRARLEALETDSRFDFQLKEHEASSGSENRSLPEATTFGLVGTMVLLGLAAVRNLNRANS
jgi:hypothetical protein